MFQCLAACKFVITSSHSLVRLFFDKFRLILDIVQEVFAVVPIGDRQKPVAGRSSTVIVNENRYEKIPILNSY